MISIFQIQPTDSQVNAFNAGNSVPAMEAKRKLMFGADDFTPDMLQYYTETMVVDTDDLDDAFELTNLWYDESRITRITARQSSSSVGDIFGHNGRYYMVDSFGFEELKLFADEVEMLEAV